MALNSSSLWCLIDFRGDPLFRLGRLSLLRSRQCDLSVTIDTSTMDVPTLQSADMHRWRDLTLLVDDYKDAHLSIATYLDSFTQETTHSPSLHSLSLICPSDMLGTLNDTLNRKLSELARVTKLREVHFECIDPSISEAGLYTHLAYLSLTNPHGCSLRRIHTILRVCPQLRTLKLRELKPVRLQDDDVSWQDQPLEMEHLEELTIEFEDKYVADVARFLLDRLTSPALRYLAIEIYGNHLSVASFLSRTPSIRHLRLCSEPGRHIMTQAIRALVNLETLTFGDEGYYSHFEDFSFLDDLPHSACPKLVRLNVHLADATDHLSSIKQFIERRAVAESGVAPIRTVAFDCLHNHSSEKKREWDKAWFSALTYLAQCKFHDVIGDIEPEYWHSRTGHPCPFESRAGSGNGARLSHA